MSKIVKTIAEASYHERKLEKKTRNPHPKANNPAFRSTSERYMENLLTLNLSDIDDKIKTEKAIEKKVSVEEI